MRAFITSILLLATVSIASAQPAPDPSTTVDQVQKFYSNIKQVTAMFRQEVTNTTFGSTKQSDGTLWIEKPGKMRWDYLEQKPSPAGSGASPTTVVKKSFISDGAQLWVVDHENKQVVKKNLAQDMLPVAVTFLYGKGNLKADFNPSIDTSSSYGTKTDIVLKLTPKQPSAQYKALYLVLNPGDFHVKESVIVDSSNNTNHFHFYSPDFDKPIKDSWFQFDPASVKSYRVVDADQQQQVAGSGTPPANK